MLVPPVPRARVASRACTCICSTKASEVTSCIYAIGLQRFVGASRYCIDQGKEAPGPGPPFASRAGHLYTLFMGMKQLLSFGALYSFQHRPERKKTIQDVRLEGPRGPVRRAGNSFQAGPRRLRGSVRAIYGAWTWGKHGSWARPPADQHSQEKTRTDQQVQPVN